MDVLGLCAFDRPSAACLVRDGRVVAAVHEDVLSGRPGDRSFPANAVAYCLRAGKIGVTALDVVRIAGSLDGEAPEAYRGGGASVSSFSGRVARWLGRRFSVRDLLQRELDASVPTEDVDAGAAEAAAAYHSSPFGEAGVAVLEPGKTSIHVGRDGNVAAMDGALGDPEEALSRLRADAGLDALCLAGTGALDRTRNDALRRRGGFAHLWVAPAPGAGAAALGAALLAWRSRADAAGGRVDAGEAQTGTAWGPSYNAAQIRTFLRSQDVKLDELGRDEAPRLAAALLAEGQRVGWLEGKLDFGEETAGSRAVLRPPSPEKPPEPGAGETLAVAAERAPEIFDVEQPCPRLVELPVRDRWRALLAPASQPDRPLPITPISAEHRDLRSLLAFFEDSTGIPALVARPLRSTAGAVACSPADAWAAKESAALETLVLGSYVFRAVP